MKNQELSKRIKELRSLKEFSQEELSEKSGISLRTVQRLENGESTPRGDTLKRLADSLETSPDYFIELQEPESTGYNSIKTDKVRFIKFPWYIIGFTLFGGSFGFFIGAVLLITNVFPNENGEAIVLSLSVLFGSLGIIVGNMIEKKK